MALSLLWHDYETSGVDPQRDRPLQFAAVRTNLALEPIAEPINVLCRLADDCLPHPQAALITGLSPLRLAEQGVCEAQFMAQIHSELSQSGTCAVGYNSLRFDAEVTRHSLYRNFFDAYEHEWRNSNSRWDIIDLVRMAYALRPEGIEWPVTDEGKVSFRLELLTQANAIAHEQAHDALSDVYGTIALASLVRERQPRLYEYYFGLRSKQAVAKHLDVVKAAAFVHVSGMIPASQGCMAVMLPLMPHPDYPNAVVCYDLAVDPEPLLQADAETVRRRVFTPVAELDEGEARIPLKNIYLNRCPALAPLSVLTPEVLQRWSLDLPGFLANRERLLAQRDTLQPVIAQALQREPDELAVERDPELTLYSGGFFSGGDKRVMRQLRQSAPEDLAQWHGQFADPRLDELLFRYRARNYPQTLNPTEQARWQDWRRLSLLEGQGVGLGFVEFFRALDEAQESEVSSAQQSLLADLRAYAEQLQASLV